MNRTTLKKLLTGFFLAAFIIFLGLFNASKPRIMVLHSYSSDSSWSHNVDNGIKKAIKAARNPVIVKFHYLGVENHKSASSLQVSVNEAHKAISIHKPDILIAVDDESNEFVARQYAGKSNPKIMFTAVLQPLEKYGYNGTKNVSGIKEQLPLDAVRDAIVTVNNMTGSKIAVLAMDDITGRAELAQVLSYNWAPHNIVKYRISSSFSDWKQFTADISEKADILLILSYGNMVYGNGDRRVIPRKETVEWLERYSRPVPVSICETYTEDGGGLSITPSPVDFGQKAMQISLKWVETDKRSAPPPVISSEHFRVGIRESMLKARHIKMPAIYLEAARAYNNYFQ